MLRIACSCGNILKVSDDKAGKKIRCPECNELVLAKQTSGRSAVKTMNMSEHIAKLKASGKGKGEGEGEGEGEGDAEDSRDFEDIDAIDEAPAKKKGGAGMLLAILGVLFVLFMVLVLGALVGAYFLFLKPTDSPVVVDSGPEAGAGAPVAAAGNLENFPIRLQQPRKAGDVREVTLKVDQSTEGVPDKSGNDNVDLQCKVRTLSVESGSGQETAWELTIQRHTAKQSTALAVGTVLTGKLVSGPMKGITWQIKGTSTPVSGLTAAMLGRACGRQHGATDNQPAYVDDDDAVFGTTDKQPVGGTWNANSAVIGKLLNAGLPGNMVEVTSATGKLSSVNWEAPGRIAEVDVTIDATMDSKKVGGALPGEMTGTMQVKLGYQVPVENAQGPIRVTYNVDAKITASQKGITVNIAHKETMALDIKYLASEPIETTKVPETPKPFVMKLAKGTAKWVVGANNSADVDIAADYSVKSGTANGTKQYMLYLAYTSAKGTKDYYLVATAAGTQLAFAPDGKLSGIAKGIVGPVPTPNQPAELVLKEGPVGKPLTDPAKTPSLDASVVPIAGTPSTAPTTTPKVQVELSAHKVERSGKNFKLQADYKVVGGKFDEQATYRWEVELAGSKIPKGAKDTLTTQPGSNMKPKDMLTTSKEFTQDFGQGLTYTMRLVEDKNKVSTIVSTREVTGEVTGSAEAPMPAVKLAAVITATVQPQGKQVIMTVQYKLNGPPDPNATYQFFYELKGGKGKNNTGWQVPANMQQPVSGMKLKQEDTFSFPIVILGQNQYEVVLREFTQANPQGNLLGSFKGK
jgi:DNA-directed RNA polymerase subunit RPC12/RpoP